MTVAKHDEGGYAAQMTAAYNSTKMARQMGHDAILCKMSGEYTKNEQKLVQILTCNQWQPLYLKNTLHVHTQYWTAEEKVHWVHIATQGTQYKAVQLQTSMATAMSHTGYKKFPSVQQNNPRVTVLSMCLNYATDSISHGRYAHTADIPKQQHWPIKCLGIHCGNAMYCT